MLLVWLLPDWTWAGLSLMAFAFTYLVIDHKPIKAWLLGLFFGLAWVLLAVQQQQDSQVGAVLKSHQTTIQIQGLIKSQPQRQQFRAKDLQTGQKWLVNWYQMPAAWQSGETLSVTLDIKPPHGTLNRHGFDRERWLFRQGIDGLATLKTWTSVSTETWHPMHHIHRWRAQVAAWMDGRIKNERHKALLKALSVGDKSGFDQSDYQTFQATGTAHLVAISGLHIGMMAAWGHAFGWLLFLLIPPLRRCPRPHVQAVMAWSLAAAYALMAGLAVPTVRALTMLSVFLLFRVRKRQAWSWDVWWASLLVLLFFDPLAILDTGMALSFGAVVILLLLFQGREPLSKTTAFIKAQAGLMVGLLPFQLLLHGSIQWATPFVNALAIPLVSVLMVPLLFLLLVCQGMLGWSPEFLWQVLLWLVDGFEFWLSLFAESQGWRWDVVVSQWWQWPLLCVGLLGLLLPKVWPQRWVCVFWLVPALWPVTQRPQPGEMYVQLFDVGQGLSVWIQTAHHDVLYDVGAQSPSGFNWADAVVVPSLKRSGVDALDAVVLSHRDNDHAGGWQALQQDMPVDQVYGSEVNQTPCVRGVSWQWDGVSFEVLSPYNLDPYLKNESSCVVRIQSQFGSLLLTGDIEAAVEYRLVSQHATELASDVMLIPHHGSKTSSTEPFITAVNPKWVVNASGQHNPFNHPNAEVLSRYAVPVFDTQQLGQLTLSFQPNGEINGWRPRHPKLWRAQKKPGTSPGFVFTSVRRISLE